MREVIILNKKSYIYVLLNLFTSFVLIIGQLGLFPLIGVALENNGRIAGDDPGVSISGSSNIESRQQVELNIHLSSSAGYLNEDGKIQITIPHTIVQDKNDILEKLVIGAPFYLDDSPLKTDSKGDYVLTVWYDHTKISQEDAVGYTFTIKFVVPIINQGDENIPDSVEFPVDFYKGDKLVSSDKLSSSISRLNNSLPNLSKWSTRPKKIIDGNEVALMSLDDPKSNIYAITVNYDQRSMKNVTLTDKTPEGTQLTDPDTYIPAVGDLTPYQHIRIAKVTARKEDGTPSAWKYVTNELKNKISVNDQGFKIDFGDLTASDSYVVMYGEEILGNPTPEEFGVKTNHAEILSNSSLVTSYDSYMALDNSSYNGISLNKKVKQSTLADTQGILEYTLTLKSSSGSIPAGTVINDPLPEYTAYTKTISKDNSKVSDPVYDSATRNISYTLLDTLDEGESLTIVFNVSYNNENAKSGDQIVNKASINYNGTNIYSNDAVTILDGSAYLTKLAAENKNSLAGAVFKVIDSNGKTVIENLVSDSNGKVNTGLLAPGNYSFIETKAPENYQIDSSPIPFTVVSGQETPVILSATNSLTPGGVVLTKTDDQTGEGLAGAVFELQDKDGNPVQSGLSTDESGKLAIDGLTPGKYQLVETKAPTGYDLDKKPVSFTIEKGQKEAVKVIKTNRRKTNSILLEKIDSKTGERLPNAVFMIRDRSNGKAIQKDLKTDKFGYLSIEGLSEGSYELIEVKAPKGYILDNTPVEFNISNQVSMEKLTKVNVPKNSVNISKNNDNSFPKTGEQDQSYLITVGIIILVLLFGVIISMILLQKMNNK